jgi:hypothetical protein
MASDEVLAFCRVVRHRAVGESMRGPAADKRISNQEPVSSGERCDSGGRVLCHRVIVS